MDRNRNETSNRSLKQNLALLLTSVAFVLVAGEGIARLCLAAPLPWLYPQLRYRPDPMLIFSLRPDQRAFTADKAVSINDRGLRGPLMPYEHGEDLRAVFLGDSIVFGYGVADGEDVSSRLHQALAAEARRVEVLNTGVPSYNIEQEVAYLEHEGLRYSPDWVVIGFCWNDLSEKTGVTVNEDGWLVEDGKGPPGATERFMGSTAGYRIRNAIKRSRLAYGAAEGARALMRLRHEDSHTRFRRDVLEGRESTAVQEGWERVERALTRARELSRQHGFHVLVAAFPLPLKLDREYPSSGYPGRLQALCEREGLLYLDLEPAFRAAYAGHDSLFIPYDGDHPNAKGHDVAARAIVQVLAPRLTGPLGPGTQ